jgi:tRNA (adenine37-N6)-methyltransferase
MRSSARVLAAALVLALPHAFAGSPASGEAAVYEVHPIGWVRRAKGRTTTVLEDQYRPGLLGVDALESIGVLYWFDRNDSPEQL